MSQNIRWLGNDYPNVPYVELPKTTSGYAQFTDVSPTTVTDDSQVESGKIYFRSDGSQHTGSNSGGGGGGKNVQAYLGYDTRKANSYGATGVTLTVAKTGTYKVSWCAARGSSSGTMGTNLHRNNSSGTNQQTWTGTYWQCIILENQSLTQGDVLTLYATSGSTSRSIYVGNLIIEEQ